MVATSQFFGLTIGLPYEFDDAFEVGYEWWRIMFLFTCLPAILQVRSHSSSQVHLIGSAGLTGALDAVPSVLDRERTRSRARVR